MVSTLIYVTHKHSFFGCIIDWWKRGLMNCIIDWLIDWLCNASKSSWCIDCIIGPINSAFELKLRLITGPLYFVMIDKFSAWGAIFSPFLVVTTSDYWLDYQVVLRIISFISLRSRLRPRNRLIDWLVDLLIDWLISWLNDWLIDWLNVGLIDWLVDWLIGWLIDWLIGWLINWLIGWLINWLID